MGEVRDDLYDLDRAERRRARRAWRRTPFEQRMEALRVAKEGMPAPEPRVSAAARRYGQYLLTRRFSNRMPRSLLPTLGAVVTVAGVFWWRDGYFLPEPAWTGPFCIFSGIMVLICGLLSWSQRQGGRLLVQANPEQPEASEADQVPQS